MRPGKGSNSFLLLGVKHDGIKETEFLSQYSVNNCVKKICVLWRYLNMCIVEIS